MNKQTIIDEIKKAINRHLVLHVKVNEGDNRDRIDILSEEAANEILSKVRTLKFRELTYEEIESQRCKQYPCIL